MKILVCIKQVLDPETHLIIDPEKVAVRPAHEPRYQLNHFDEFAIEEAVRLKAATPGARVEAVTVGPERAGAVLERARGMGCDAALHILCPEKDWPAPETTAGWIAEVAGGRGYELVLAGVMSEDLMLGLTGPYLAARLGWPYAVGVMALTVENGQTRVERELAGGRREILTLKLPAVICVQSGINKPRYPTLSNLLRAKKEPPERIDAASLSRPAPLAATVGVSLPQRRRACRTLEGATRDKAESLLRILEAKSLLKKRGA